MWLGLAWFCCKCAHTWSGCHVKAVSHQFSLITTAKVGPPHLSGSENSFLFYFYVLFFLISLLKLANKQHNDLEWANYGRNQMQNTDSSLKIISLIKFIFLFLIIVTTSPIKLLTIIHPELLSPPIIGVFSHWMVIVFLLL